MISGVMADRLDNAVTLIILTISGWTHTPSFNLLLKSTPIFPSSFLVTAWVG